jgi:hypothetical protein
MMDDILSTVNARLYDQPYIIAVADHTYFAELQDRIRKLDYVGPLPDVLGQGAWQRTWNLWQELQRQPKPEHKPPSGPEPWEILQNAARRLKTEREFLKNVLSRERYEERDLDLLPGDLSAVPVDNDDLLRMSSRVSVVYNQLRPLSSDQVRIYFIERELRF